MLTPVPWPCEGRVVGSEGDWLLIWNGTRLVVNTKTHARRDVLVATSVILWAADDRYGKRRYWKISWVQNSFMLSLVHEVTNSFDRVVG